LSDIDFDDESTDDDLTPAPPTLNKKQVLDRRVAKAKNLSEGDSAAKQLASQIDDQLLATITVEQAESVSNLELQALSVRNLLLDAMNDPESDEESVVAAKKLYMDALQKQLNYHETLARVFETFLEPDFKNKITSDPLLSDEDIASLNSNIMPTNSDGTPITGESLGFKREIVDAGLGLYTSGDDFFRTPARMARAAEAKKRIAAELNLPDGWEVDLDDDQQALAEIAKIPGRLERQSAYRAYALSTKPRYLTVRPKDPALRKHGILLELDNDDSSLLATQEEVALVANSFNEVHGRVDLSNLQFINQNSLLTRYNSSGALYIKIGTLMPVKVSATGVNLGLFESDESAKKGNAATSPGGVISINLVHLRKFDDPEFREDRKGFYWKDVESSAEKIKSTISHEIGHQIHYAITDADNYSELRKKAAHLDEEGEVSTEYSRRNETEHFAESISKFIATGEATDRVKNILANNGLIQAEPTPDAEGSPERKTGLFNEYTPERANEITAENTSLTDLGFDPEEEITIYRGVPNDVDSINSGDWVTTLPQLAKDYAGADGKVVSSKVKAKDLLADPSSGEGAYTEEMVYRPSMPAPAAEASPDSSDQEALEQAYEELKAANRVQMMEPKSTADKKLNGDDYLVMDSLRDVYYNTDDPVIDIYDIEQAVEANAELKGTLSKTIASLKKKGILTTVPGDKNKLALTEDGIKKVAIVQAGFDKERREIEERRLAREAEVDAERAAKEAAKTDEQRKQEEEERAEFRAKKAAIAEADKAKEEKIRLFYETNPTPSEKEAIKLIENALYDDISEIGEGSQFDRSNFEDDVEAMYELRGTLPEGETPSSLAKETISSLKKKGFITTVPGDKDTLALTKLGAEKVKGTPGLEPDAEGSGPEEPTRNRALDVDLSDFDFDSDDDGEVEPNEIAAVAKSIAASGIGMKLDGRKSTRAIDTAGAPIMVSSSRKPGIAPSAQATDIKNNVVALGNQVLDAAYKAAEEKLKEQGILPEGMSIKEYAPIARLEEQRIIETSERDDFAGRQKLKDLMRAEIDRIAKDITDEEFKQYLADRGVPEDKASAMTLDGPYEPYYFSDRSSLLRYPEGPGAVWIKDSLGEKNEIGEVNFDTGGGFDYNFTNAIDYGWNNRQRIAALKLVREGKLSDYKELDDLAYETRKSYDRASYTRKNRFADKSKEIIRDSIYEELKKAGVEFDSVDMSEYVGKYEPRARRRSGWKGLSEKTRAELEAAFDYIPKDILLAAKAYLNEIKKAAPNDSTTGIIGIIESEARAHFSTIGWGGYLRGNTADDFLHEFWHFFQEANPDIAVVENAFLYDRLKDSNGNLSNTESVDFSYQFTNGNFSEPYITKQYPLQGAYFDGKNKYNEVSTVGMQDLFTSPGKYSGSSKSMIIVGKGKNKVLYRNPHMDIATGIWYTDSSMTEKIPGQEVPGNISVRGRADHLGEDTEFRAFNIGLMLSLLDWENK